jgi:hypothetical protein
MDDNTVDLDEIASVGVDQRGHGLAVEVTPRGVID